MTINERIRAISKALEGTFPEPQCGLIVNSEYQFFLATSLAARYADEAVNAIVPKIEKDYPTFNAIANAKQNTLLDLINDVTYAEKKAKNIIEAAIIIMHEYNGSLPRERNQLEMLPGIGRKSANMILTELFDISTFPIDTHIKRVAQRTGIASTQDETKIEYTFCNAIPQNEWKKTYRRLILQGKKICTFFSPRCSLCSISSLCKTTNKESVPTQLCLF